MEKERLTQGDVKEIRLHSNPRIFKSMVINMISFTIQKSAQKIVLVISRFPLLVVKKLLLLTNF